MSSSTSTAIFQDQEFVAAPGQVSSELSGEAVILSLQSGTYFGLNEVGAFVWLLLKTVQTFSGICDAVQAQYEVEREMCEADVQALLQQLQAAKLVEVKELRLGYAA
jgi:hypothetical protein